ncbi:cytochrome-c peroxidase [Exilibacterium tricleocarpae]|uniref:Cytochrome-c peroxidase n=1 Tax=Exilibacterium tricleocarpae TaxID=2591008 RepID=A0A545SMF3_9GAMM|nr:cytochrome-c peroxidase [Exilibacterium tricleocarpae]TQV66168.1 cytochrome-c peroxidase [Exilibacterium tricleocarpae]
MMSLAVRKRHLFSCNTHFRSWVLLIVCFLLSNSVALGQSTEPIDPIAPNATFDKQKVALGEKLFHDPQLSKNNRIACASCHDLKHGGTDGLRYSLGVSGKPGATNAPTVFNVGNHFVFFWDGRAKTLEEQIEGPIHNPDEMASNWTSILRKLSNNEEYIRRFHKIYQSPPTKAHVKDAIATFERSLNTPNSPFDRYLLGAEDAISSRAMKGYDYFKSFGCTSCHQGQNIGGNMYQTFGVVGDYFKDRGSPVTTADLGRYNVTGKDWDKYVFKVPSLRNVEVTAPYFHDGSAQTLEDAVKIMARYQLGRELNREEITAIIEFLETLTGEYKGKKLNAK